MFSPIEGEGEPHASINYAEIGHTGVGREWSERFRPSTAYQSGTGERVTGSRQLMLLVRRHTATLGTVPSAAPQMNDLLDIIRSQQGQIGGDNQHIGHPPALQTLGGTQQLGTQFPRTAFMNGVCAECAGCGQKLCIPTEDHYIPDSAHLQQFLDRLLEQTDPQPVSLCL